ncbi:hypothetical protein EVG20_g11377, partial [Dentipellis fragilis]
MPRTRCHCELPFTGHLVFSELDPDADVDVDADLDVDADVAHFLDFDFDFDLVSVLGFGLAFVRSWLSSIVYMSHYDLPPSLIRVPCILITLIRSAYHIRSPTQYYGSVTTSLSHPHPSACLPSPSPSAAPHTQQAGPADPSSAAMSRAGPS